mgnify:CR=1 FL=1
MLHEKHMPKFYWTKLASLVVYLSNGVHETTPYETYMGRKLILSHMTVFRSIVYVHIPNKK